MQRYKSLGEIAHIDHIVQSRDTKKTKALSCLENFASQMFRKRINANPSLPTKF